MSQVQAHQCLLDDVEIVILIERNQLLRKI